jgi:hypothetical protein
MTQSDTAGRGPCCLDCGHFFSAAELAAMTVMAHHEDLCIIDCADCGAHNIGHTELQPGLDHHPVVVLLRLAKRDPETGSVFDETVERGVYVHPVSRGESQ